MLTIYKKAQNFALVCHARSINYKETHQGDEEFHY